MEQMKEVTRYECRFCKKDFKTPNKHQCKFRPELKNCFTCKHLKGWESDYLYDNYIKIPFPDCAEGCDGWDLEIIKGSEYDMQCEKWEKGKFDWSKESD